GNVRIPHARRAADRTRLGRGDVDPCGDAGCGAVRSAEGSALTPGYERRARRRAKTCATNRARDVISVAPGGKRARFHRESRFPHRTEDHRHQVGERPALSGHRRKSAVVDVRVVESGGRDPCVGTFGGGERVAGIAHAAPNGLVSERLLRFRLVHVRAPSRLSLSSSTPRATSLTVHSARFPPDQKDYRAARSAYPP